MDGKQKTAELLEARCLEGLASRQRNIIREKNDGLGRSRKEKVKITSLPWAHARICILKNEER